MKIRVKYMISIIFVAIFGGILLSSVLGYWKTESTKIPGKIETGESAGEYNPMDIKGSYTFNDVSKNFNIPLDDLANAFLVPIDKAKDFKCKDLESNYTDTQGKEIGTGSVRLFVASYKGITVELIDDTYLPKSAIDVLLKKGKPTQEQKDFIQKHSVEVK